MRHLLIVILFTLNIQSFFAQSNQGIHWKTWPELEEAYAQKPKPVFVYFHAKWCAYCKKINRDVFSKNKVIEKINNNYYAVTMDVETLDTIVFDGVTFINKQANTKRNAIHELPLLLASRKNKQFTLPVTLIFNRDFVIKERLFSYYTSKKILSKL